MLAKPLKMDHAEDFSDNTTPCSITIHDLLDTCTFKIPVCTFSLFLIQYLSLYVIWYKRTVIHFES